MASGVTAHMALFIAALMPSLRAAIVAPPTAHGPMAAEAAASAKAGWCVTKSCPASAPPVRLSISFLSLFAATSHCFCCSLSFRRFSRRCWLP